MLESIFEYIVVLLLGAGIGLYLFRNKIKEYFQPTIIVTSPANLSRKVKNGYLNLLDLLYHNSNKDDLEREIRYIATQRLDGRYVGGYTKDTDEFDSLSFVLDYFYDIVNYSENRRENFILSLELTDGIEELNKLLKLSLGKLLETVPLPIRSENIFLDYQKVLNQHDIQMASIDDGSDTSYIILHQLDKENAVKKAISNIGFEYSKILN